MVTTKQIGYSDTPLLGTSRAGISLGKNDKAFPTYKEHSWSGDRKTLTIVFVTQPSTTYGVQMLGENFVSEDGRQA